MSHSTRNTATTFRFLGLLAFILLGGISAHPQDQQTIYFTFKGPFEIPAFESPKVLPAGDYVFKVLVVKSDHDIVQIFQKDGSHSFGTVLTVPDRALKKASGQPVATFGKAIGDTPPALKSLFFPAQPYGQLIVYPKPTALQLAQANNEAVLSMSQQDSVNMSEAIRSADDPAAQHLEIASVKAEKPNGQEVEMSQVVTSP